MDIQRDSKAYSLNKQDFKALFREMIIIYSPVILLFLEQIEAWNFDYKVLFALAVSITINMVRRYLTDYTKNTK